MSTHGLAALRVSGSLFLVAFLVAATASLASPYSDLLGHHPHHGQLDPYLAAVDQRERDCCHGADCVRFYGDVERVPATADRPAGWMFGPWFVEESKLIKVDTLSREVRGFHSICFAYGREGALRSGAQAIVRCGYPAESGT